MPMFTRDPSIVKIAPALRLVATVLDILSAPVALRLATPTASKLSAPPACRLATPIACMLRAPPAKMSMMPVLDKVVLPLLTSAVTDSTDTEGAVTCTRTPELISTPLCPKSG